VREWLGKELVMPKKRFSAEQIVTLLRQIEVLMAQGNPTPVACRAPGVINISYLGFRAIQEGPIIQVSLGLIWGTPAKWPGTCL
jgi:hypothetical protein